MQSKYMLAYAPDSHYKQPCHRRQLQGPLASTVRYSEPSGCPSQACAGLFRCMGEELGVHKKGSNGDRRPPAGLPNQAEVKHFLLGLRTGRSACEGQVSLVGSCNAALNRLLGGQPLRSYPWPAFSQDQAFTFLGLQAWSAALVAPLLPLASPTNHRDSQVWVLQCALQRR